MTTTKTLPLAEVLAKVRLPLRVNRHGYGSPYLSHEFIEDIDGRPVCGVWHPDGHQEQDAASALLTHAANVLPALVAALEELLYTHSAAREYPDGPCIERDMRKDLVAALEAARNVPAP